MINLSNSISKYLFQAMVDIPETMDCGTILSQPKYPCSEIYQRITKSKLVKSLSLICLNMTFHYIIIKKRKVLKWTHYHITLPKHYFLIRTSYIIVELRWVTNRCIFSTFHLFTFPFNICYFITNFQVCH